LLHCPTSVFDRQNSPGRARKRKLAVEIPTKFELVINLKAAKTFGLRIPESDLLRAA
jgi:ABC-type uncharacterized transport system substrate-binding protein